MTSSDDLDRRLTARLSERAAPSAPQGLSETATQRVERTRQLPAWATSGRWISMETRAQLGTVPRTAIMLATIALLTILAAGAIVVGSSTVKVPAPFGPASNGAIAYDAQGDIWLVSADGQTTTRLTSGPDFELDPRWSLDGTKIAYTTLTDDTYGLSVASADGTGTVTLASGLEVAPANVQWSPDGSALMLALTDGSLDKDHCGDIWATACGSRLWVAASDGSSLGRVGPADLDAASGSWSPDGSTIAFAGRVSDGPDEEFGLFLMEADGADVRRLGDLTGPAPGRAFFWNLWSPDGTRIVTQSVPNTVYVVDVASGEATAVASGPKAGVATWSHDGEELAISNWNVGGAVVGMDGERLDIDGIPVGGLRWSPDGSMLVGYSEQPREAIYLLDLDGHLLATVDAPYLGNGDIDLQRLAP